MPVAAAAAPAAVDLRKSLRVVAMCRLLFFDMVPGTI